MGPSTLWRLSRACWWGHRQTPRHSWKEEGPSEPDAGVRRARAALPALAVTARVLKRGLISDHSKRHRIPTEPRTSEGPWTWGKQDPMSESPVSTSGRGGGRHSVGHGGDGTAACVCVRVCEHAHTHTCTHLASRGTIGRAFSVTGPPLGSLQPALCAKAVPRQRSAPPSPGGPASSLLPGRAPHPSRLA